jgi:hypothetical protein
MYTTAENIINSGSKLTSEAVLEPLVVYRTSDIEYRQHFTTVNDIVHSYAVKHINIKTHFRHRSTFQA